MRKLSDKKRLVILICIFAAFAMIIASAGVLSKWLIVPTVSDSPINYPEAKNSPFFTDEATYNGSAFLPELTPEGAEIYNLSNGDFTYICTSEWNNNLSCVYSREEGNIEPHESVNSGKHYYTIIDNTTGQIITDSHCFTINRANVNVNAETVTCPSDRSYYYDGETDNFFGTLVITDADGNSVNYAENADFSASVAFTGTSSVCNAALSIKQGVYDNNVIIVGETLSSSNVKANAIAYNGNTYYGRVETALSSSTSGTVYVIPYAENDKSYSQQARTITFDSVISSDVTFAIPYDGESIENREGTTNSPTLTNKVLIAPKITLTNNGSIKVGGVVGVEKTPAISGATSGAFGMIEMGNGSTIQSTGSILCLGYVTESSGAAATVVATSGTITMPFVVYDYGGGTQTCGVYKGSGGPIAPFNVFDMPNIHPALKCSSGVTVNGYADLYTATVFEQHNPTDIKLLGTSGALINLSSGTVTFDHKPDSDFTTTYKPSFTSKTEILLNGNAKSGDLSMEISIAKVINETVSLSTVFFPISGKLSLDLMGKYTYEFTSDYKFLPGSSLTVRDEATLVINESCDLILYESYPVKNSSGAVLTASNSYYAPYFDEKDTVELSLYGNMIVNGGFAGHIDAKSAFASVDFSGARTLSVTSAEGNGDADTDDYWGLLNGSAFTFTKIYDVTLSANGDIADSPDYTSVKNFNKDNEYIAIGDDDGYVWTYKKAIAISYDSNGGLNIPSKSASVNATDGLTLADEYLPVPIRDYYEFGGWYLDFALTQPAIGQTVYSDTTLYAKWTAITYTLEFAYTGDIKPDSAPPESQTFNAESTVTINIPSDDVLTFTAWYTDSAFKNELTSLTVSGKDIAGYAVDNVVTLYGLWTSIQHTVNFIEVKYADELDGSTTRMITPAQINNPLPTVSYSYNTGREYYFDKWMLVHEDGTETEITTYSFVDAHATESITYTVKAIYKQKVSLTVDYGSNDLSLSNPEGWIWLKPGESISVSDITTGDNNVDITKYSKGWACEECSVNGTTVTINSDAPEGATATATAEWGTKHTFTVNIDDAYLSSYAVKINDTEYDNGSVVHYAGSVKIEISAKGKTTGALWWKTNYAAKVTLSDGSDPKSATAPDEDVGYSNTQNFSDEGETIITVEGVEI